jgi:hypothetical protein
MVARLPIVAEQLIGNIPRLEAVRGMVIAAVGPVPELGSVIADPLQALIAQGARLLHAAYDFDKLDVEGQTPTAIFKTLRKRTGRYEPALLDALEAVRGSFSGPDDTRDVALADLEVGMVFFEDVTLVTGALLAARGYEVTRGFVARAENFGASLRKGTVRVTGPKPK